MAWFHLIVTFMVSATSQRLSPYRLDGRTPRLSRPIVAQFAMNVPGVGSNCTASVPSVHRRRSFDDAAPYGPDA